VGRFLTRDSYTGESDEPESLHLYTYCENDGVNSIDPSGHVPKPVEAAEMVEFAREANEENIQIEKTISFDWRLSGIYRKKKMKMCIYYSKSTKEYCVVNKGSDTSFTLTTFSDWINNFIQPTGNSWDMKNSIKFAKKFVQEHKKEKITFVGHSKGGAEAMANAVATNRDCIVFNPAPINYKKYGLKKNMSKYKASMFKYVVKGEFLAKLRKKNNKEIGNYIYLPKQYKSGGKMDSIHNHTIDAVIAALKSMGYNHA